MGTDTETPPEIPTEPKRKRGRPLKGTAPMTSSQRVWETRKRQANAQENVVHLALDLLRDLTLSSPGQAKRYITPSPNGRDPLASLHALASKLHPIAFQQVLTEIEAIKERLEKFTAEAEREKEPQQTA